MNEAFRVAVVDDDPAQLQLLTSIVSRQRPAWEVISVVADQAWIAAVHGDASVALGGASCALVDYRLVDQIVTAMLPSLSTAALVVVMSGSPAGLDHEACLAAGARAIVPKPFSLKEAESMLQTCDAVFGG